MNRIKHILILLGLAITTACSTATDKADDGKTIEIKRFEDLIFKTPISDLHQALIANQHDYRFFFNTDISSPEYFEEIKQYASDSIMQQVYNVVATTYPDLSWLEKELATAMEKSNELLPNEQPKNFYTMISGTFGYYDRVICNDSFMAINMDQYAVKNMKYFNGYFGMPMYIVNLLDSIYLPTDCMAAYAISKIATPRDKEQSLLDVMIIQGKVLYFLDQIFPNTADSIKIRYTADQMKWAIENENNMWGYFIQKNLLYETDYTKIRSFINEAPSTTAFENSAPRMCDFIGWKIVNKYMKKKDVSIKDLFLNTDSQQILTDSGYKPKRK